MPQGSLPKLIWLEHRQSWLAPLAEHYTNPVVEGEKGRVRICLRLEDGVQMEIPLTQAAIDGLADQLATVRTPQAMT